MKKLLSLLGAVGLIATSSATVVSCGDPDKGTSNNGGNDDFQDSQKSLDHFFNFTQKGDQKYNYDLGAVTLTEENTIEGVSNLDGDSTVGSIYEQLVLSFINPDCLTNGSNKVVNMFATDWGYDSTLNTLVKSLKYKSGAQQTVKYTEVWQSTEEDEQGNFLGQVACTFSFVINNSSTN
jgi:hypothetical protein